MPKNFLVADTVSVVFHCAVWGAEHIAEQIHNVSWNSRIKDLMAKTFRFASKTIEKNVP